MHSPANHTSGPGIGWTLAAASLAFVVIQLDVTIVNLALPQIGQQWRADLAAMQWIVDAYTLALAVMLLTAGVLSDRLGSRRIFLAGFATFALASLLCGLAPSAGALIAARVLQGVGGALVLPTSLALIAHACRGDARARARAVGIWSASGAFAVAAGPMLGGALVGTAGWRWIFLINLPLCLAGLLIAVRRVADTPKTGRGGFDLPGQLLACVALTALVASLIAAGGKGRADAAIGAGLLLCAASGAAFLVRQARTAHPLVPLDMFRNAPFSSAVLSATALCATFYGLMFVLSLYFQGVLRYTPAQAGLAFLPLTAVIMFANLASAGLVRRLGYRLAIGAGLLVAAAGYGWLAMLPAGAALRQMAPAMMLVTLGMGAAIPATTAVVLGSAAGERAGTAVAILNTARQIGGALGVALFGALAGGDAQALAARAGTVYAICAALMLAALCQSLAFMGRAAGGASACAR
ncbi:MFS transporter [Janthinobacterium fluminis]|uniref:MFS transporter n=1 Tax=Janthinobacterium fluminis TaxID=2987524 RepID=A0ABT5K5L6_9BURK|nr:MFS transporter [Janthinobacterium fluminis]MDC8759730.1 MFS transporter [Janthinobacterium fluminis]